MGSVGAKVTVSTFRVACTSLWAAGVLAAVAGCDRRPALSAQLAEPALYQPLDRGFLQECAGCHAIDGAMAGAPPRPVPRLRSQHPTYLAAALRAYRSGKRRDVAMNLAAAGLTDDQIDLAARALAGSQLPNPPKFDGTPPPMTVQGVCAGCHGQTGRGIIPDYPVIGGQRLDYLTAALADYRSGKRKSPVMRTIVQELPAEQLEEAAAYFASREGLAPIAPEQVR